MQNDLVACFQSATKTVFDTMLGCEAVVKEPEFGAKVEARQDVTGFVQLTGKASGMAAVSFSRSAALLATAAMGSPVPTEINDDVLDVVGEVANMIVGSAKRKLSGLDLKIGLPMVVSGVAHRLHFPGEVTGACLPFDTSWGLVVVQIALKGCAVPEPVEA